MSDPVLRRQEILTHAALVKPGGHHTASNKTDTHALCDSNHRSTHSSLEYTDSQRWKADGWLPGRNDGQVIKMEGGDGWCTHFTSLNCVL